MPSVTIRQGAKVHKVEATKGQSMLSALQHTQELYFDAPCGGNGKCGKCRVTVDGAASEVTLREKEILGEPDCAKGIRLACRMKIEGDCIVTLPDVHTEIDIEHDPGDAYVAGETSPIVSVATVVLPEAHLGDQRDSTLRLAQALKIPESHLPLSLRQRIGELPLGRELQAVYSDRQLIDIRESERGAYGIAVDIGTSTVVLYLVDLAAAETVGAGSAMNAQKSYGADVISRISHASSSPENLDVLQRRIVEQIQSMAAELLEPVGGRTDDVVLLVAAGNTTMMHLLAGVDPERIAAAPFVPSFTDPLVVPASEIGFAFHPSAEVRLLPSVAAYVGADIVAGIVATSMDSSERYNLLVDLGTNCEMVLGNSNRMIACATAAGPAFEGAQIECGVGGIAGAIRKVWVDEGIHFDTIDDEAPLGICGSGILDTVAVLLDEEIIDETGRMNSPADGDTTLRFVLSPNGEKAEIYFSQKDVREVQLAKAAIAAGIEVLTTRMGIGVEEIGAVYLAGSFGSALSPDSACRIGLLPEVLRNRVVAVGNSAGRGVLLALHSKELFERCETLRQRVEYIELSGDAQFSEAYIDHMIFPPK